MRSSRTALRSVGLSLSLLVVFGFDDRVVDRDLKTAGSASAGRPARLASVAAVVTYLGRVVSFEWVQLSAGEQGLAALFEDVRRRQPAVKICRT